MPWLGLKIGLVFGRVGEPAAVGRAAEDPRRVQEDAAGEEHPERQRVQPREGDVAGADLQRHQVVHERRAHRHDHEEDHRHAVHGEGLVVEVGRDQLAVGLRPAGTRMSSASMPPRTKKNSAEAPYMMPTFLWSTPVTHAFHPCATAGRAKTPSGSARRRGGAVAAREGERAALGDLGDGHQLCLPPSGRDRAIGSVAGRRGSRGSRRAGRSRPRSGRGRACPGQLALRRVGVHRLLRRRVAEPRLELRPG